MKQNKFSAIKYSTLAIYAVFLMLQSCITDRKLIRSYEHNASFQGYPEQSKIDGTYKNNNDSLDKNKDGLLSCIVSSKRFGNFTNTGKLINSYQSNILQAAAIIMHYDGKKRLNIKVVDNTRQIPQFTLRVKNKGRYLSVHRKTFLLPLPGFIMYTNYKMLLFHVNNHLVLVSGRGSFAEAFLIIPVLKKIYSVEIFEKQS